MTYSRIVAIRTISKLACKNCQSINVKYWKSRFYFQVSLLKEELGVIFECTSSNIDPLRYLEIITVLTVAESFKYL